MFAGLQSETVGAARQAFAFRHGKRNAAGAVFPGYDKGVIQDMDILGFVVPTGNDLRIEFSVLPDEPAKDLSGVFRKNTDYFYRHEFFIYAGSKLGVGKIDIVARQ